MDAARRVQVEIEVGMRASQPADVDDAALDLGGREILVRDLTGYLIDNQVHAFTACGLQHLIDPAGIARIHRQVSAEFLQSPPARRIG